MRGYNPCFGRGITTPRRIALEWEDSGVTTTAEGHPTTQSVRIVLLTPTRGGFTHYKFEKKTTSPSSGNSYARGKLGIVSCGNMGTGGRLRGLVSIVGTPNQPGPQDKPSAQHLRSSIVRRGKCSAPMYCRNKLCKKKAKEEHKRVY